MTGPRKYESGNQKRKAKERRDFLVGMVIWYEILNKVNKVSKVLQKKDMNIDDAISLLKGSHYLF